MGFNPFEVRFDFSGSNLVEASAGTGKTYSITAIYLRLILERGLLPNDILAVTFTVDATEELKKRIRKIVLQARSFLSGAGELEVNDDNLREYLNGFAEGDRKKLLSRLEEALILLDDAPIYTIHKFCKRLLMEHPVETNSPLNMEFSSDEEKFTEEMIFYIYRKWLYKEDEIIVNVFWENFITGNQIKNIANKYLSIAKPAVGTGNVNIKNIKNLYASVVDEYEKAKKDKKKHSTIYLKEFFSYELKKGREFELIKALNKVAKEKNFSEKFENLDEAYKNFLKISFDYILAKLLKILEEADKYTEILKSEKNLLTFSDLIRRVYFAVSNNKLKNDSFKALLIDEFQDTDFLQVHIFRNLFKNKTSFYIGDPKQSIYSFRSADLKAYFYATRDIKRRFILDVCYRSTNGLVDAFNKIFSEDEKRKPNNFFMNENIEYNKVKSHNPPKMKLVIDDNSKDFNFYLFKNDSDKKKILPYLRDEIVSLLKKAKIEESNKSKRDVRFSDICVLVKNNNDAEIIRDYLSSNGIKCTLTTTKSVFETKQAKDILAILKAINNFTNTVYVKSAIVLDIFGKTIKDVLDEKTVSLYKDRFRKFGDELNKKGPMAAFLRIFNEENTKFRILRYANGERIYTNYLHILEILQNASKHENLSTEQLIKYLKARIDNPYLAKDEGELRLESDENALRISTIHKSKGLEFPIVFLLYFASAKRHNAKRTIGFEFDEKRNGYVAKFEDNQEEKDDEAARLFYVAATRAMARFYLFDYKRRSGSIINKLLYNDKKKVDEIEGVLQKSFGEVATIKTEFDYTDIKNDEEKKIEFDIECKKAEEGIEKKSLYKLTSYSGIVRNRDISFEEELVNDETYERLPFDVPDLPPGAETGNLIHGIFEKIPFNIDDSRLKDMVFDSFSGYSDAALESAFDMIKSVLRKPFYIGSKKFMLAGLDYNKRISEMKFFLSVKDMNMFFDALISIFESRKEDKFIEAMREIKPDKIKHYLIGFIDLVFEFDGKVHIIDWKTNYLGSKFEDYSLHNLKNEIAANRYFIQFSIYQLAVYKYLQTVNSRMGLDMGDVFYIFTRGFNPEEKTGIYSYSFTKEELNELAKHIESNA